ncbi:MAG: ABC transporter substrate-binding protein [Cyclobacteriaceae bacterium]
MRLSTSYSLVITIVLTVLFSCSPKVEDRGNERVFRMNIAGGLSSLDPAYASNVAKWWVNNQLYNGLVSVDTNSAVTPDIAKSWEVSADGKRYVFHLRDDVTFHDSRVFPEGKGRKVTAHDMVFSLKRVLKTGSGAWIFNDKLLEKEGGELSDTCFVAQNDSTVAIYLKKVCPFFISILAMPYCYAVPHEAVSFYGKQLRNHPVGTGPFQMKEWYEDNKLILERNKNYWKKDENGNQLPYLDFVEVSFLGDKNQEFRLFLDKKTDFCYSLYEGARDEVITIEGKIRDHINENYQVILFPYLSVSYLGFQVDPKTAFYEDYGTDHPFLDKNFRKALDAAIDKPVLLRYLKNNIGYAGTEGIVPFGLKGYQSRVKAKEKQAIDYLRASKYADVSKLPELSFYVSESAKSIAEFLQKEWSQKLGVEIKLDMMDGGTLNELANKGKVGLFYVGWIADYPDAENFLALLTTANFKPAGPNKMHYSNPKLDRMFDKAVIEPNEKIRSSYYEKMDSMMVEDQPVIPLFYDQSLWLAQKNVKGLTSNSLGLLDLEKVSKTK